MRLKERKKFKSKLTSTIALSCTVIAIFCFVSRIPSAPIKSQSDIEMIAVKTVLPSGELPQSKDKTHDENNSFGLILKKSDSCVSDSTNQPGNKKVQAKTEDKDYSGESTYKIVESQFGASGTRYDNFYVKNTTGFDLNIGEFLSRNPDVQNVKSESPKVLILHTCLLYTSEAETVGV